MKAICTYCGKGFETLTGYINRARKLGLNVYCDRKCAGLGRRTYESKEEKIQIKQWYDLFIRASRTEDQYWFEMFRGAFNFFMDYSTNPEKYRQRRRIKQAAHNEYCRQPKYREYKKEYDLNYRANKNYGEFAEAAIALLKLEKEIDVRLAKKQNGIINKSQKRKRLWQKMQAKQQINSLLVT